MKMGRRPFLAGVATSAFAFAAPAIAQANRNVLRMIPSNNIPGIDPIATSGQPVRNFGFYVFDTLFGLDATFNVQPQMAEGVAVSDDRLTWTIKLRDGLLFHDGEKVLAKDCIASLRRWGARDPIGQTIFQVTNELSAVDDRTFQFRLKRPFRLLAQSLAKVGGPAPFIMPERLARTDPSVQIREAIGSGPLRFLAHEWIPGSRLAFAKFEGYKPRSEAPGGTAGGKVVKVDRVEWHIMPDSATAAAALARGEMDWYQQPDLALLPLLKADRNIRLEPFDRFGYQTILRFNHLQPPFDKLEARRAVQIAVNQTDLLLEEAGTTEIYTVCKSVFFCGSQMSTGAGSEVMTGDLKRAQAMLKSSGYGGERVIIISPVDSIWLRNGSLVAQDLLKQIGFNVEIQEMDLATYFRRRTITEPVDKGGWSVLLSGVSITDIFDPATHLALRGNGLAGWPGWPTDNVVEDLRTAWIDAVSATEQADLLRKIEAHAFEAVPFVPLGQFFMPSAMRTSVEGMVKAPLAVPWNIYKT